MSFSWSPLWRDFYQSQSSENQHYVDMETLDPNPNLFHFIAQFWGSLTMFKKVKLNLIISDFLLEHKWKTFLNILSFYLWSKIIVIWPTAIAEEILS